MKNEGLKTKNQDCSNVMEENIEARMVKKGNVFLSYFSSSILNF
jgi:hypothetical protein